MLQKDSYTLLIMMLLNLQTAVKLVRSSIFFSPFSKFKGLINLKDKAPQIFETIFC